MLSCNSNKSLDIDNNLLTEYYYPFDSLINPKVFIYQRTDSADKLTYHYQQLIIKNKQKILIRASFGDDGMLDSSIYSIINNTPVLLETYTTVKDPKTNEIRPSKGKILKYVDYGVYREMEFKFTDPFMSSLISIFNQESTFDTIIVYKLFDRDMDCIRYKYNMKRSVKYKYIPFFGKSYERAGKVILAKGLGTVYYSITNLKNKSTISWKLKEIIDYKKFDNYKLMHKGI